VGVTGFGGPTVLEVLELPDPEALPGQVRIRVRAATVNPVDTHVRAGTAVDLLEGAGPYVPGMEIAGEIDQIPDGTDTPFVLGDRVMGILLPRGVHGGYAERVVLPIRSVAASPRTVSDVFAATLPMNGLTARLALDVLDLRPGQVLGVTGAAGGVGGYVVQMAKAEGLIVVADASEADAELVHSLGADYVVARGAEFASRVRVTVPDGVDAVIDAAVVLAEALPAIKDGGDLVVVRGFSHPSERGITVRPVVVRDYLLANDKLESVRQLVEDGRLTPRVARTFEPEEAADAHRLLESGGSRGRLVIRF
jgi:NADPH:quinone reductase